MVIVMLPVGITLNRWFSFFSFKAINTFIQQNPTIKAIMKIWWPWSCVWSRTEVRKPPSALHLYFPLPRWNSCLKIRYIFCAECLLSMSIQELAFQASLESLLLCSKIVNDVTNEEKNEMYDFWLTEALLEFSISDTPSTFFTKIKSICYYLISMHILTAFYSLILLFGPRSEQPSFKRDNK